MARKAAASEALQEDQGRSAIKRRAIIDAATGMFLKGGFLGTNMDEIAALSGVSKQTVYKHFSSKEALFIEIVGGMTQVTGDKVHNDAADFPEGGDLAAYLDDYAFRQLSIVVTPRVMQLRRMVIGEVGRFPDLAKVLYERGPLRAMGILADMFKRLAARGLLRIDDPKMAASHFNWLVMSQALNEAMLLGDAAIPRPAELRRQAAAGVRVFLAAYGRNEKAGIAPGL
jgi:TetR/AcrR family transcriptional repressor of mexJK operon